MLDKLESPHIMQEEYTRSSRCRETGGPLTSDGPSISSLAGPESVSTHIHERSADSEVHFGPVSDRGRTSSRLPRASADLYSFQADEDRRLRMTPSSYKSNYAINETANISFSSVKTLGATHRPQVTSIYTGKMTGTEVTSRTHVAAVPRGGNPHSNHSPSLNWSADIMKLRSVSRPSGNSSNVVPPPWSHLEPSYFPRGTSPTTRVAYTLTIANSYANPRCSSTNQIADGIEPDTSSSASPGRAVSVIRSLDSRPEAALGHENELARTSQAKRPVRGLDFQGGVPSRAKTGPCSLPEAFQRPLPNSVVSGSAVDVPLLPEAARNAGPIKFTSKLGRTSASSVVDRTGVSMTQTLSTKASKSEETVVAPVKKRRGRFIGRRAKLAQDSQLAGGQGVHGKSASVPVSPGSSAKSQAENGRLGRSRAASGSVDVSRENLEDSLPLVFRPTEKEFSDPISYIESIRSQAERFGLCVIEPPDSWKPEFEIPESLRFPSQCQLVHRLKERWGPVEETVACIRKHLEQQSISLTPLPQIGGYELDLPQFSRVVAQFGGMQKVIDNKKWNRVADILRIPKNAQDRNGKLEDAYCKYLLSYDFLSKEEKDELGEQVLREREARETQGIVLESDAAIQKGRNLSMISFQRFARNIQGRLFRGTPSLDDVEKEFWNTVNGREHYVSVFNGIVNTGQLDSRFQPNRGHPVSKCGWNLNLLPLLPGSVLKHLGNVQDVTVPWLQIDMVFSANTWYSHPLALHTVDYLHTGSDRIWYCVPPGENPKFVSFMESRQSSAVCTDDPHVPMTSPDDLREHGLTVARVVQKQGQFVVVFPKAFYSNVASGYAVSEAVSFAPTEWLVYGPPLWQEVCDDPDWSEFAYEKLLLGLAEENIEGESRDILTCLLGELRALREAEHTALEALFALGLSGAETIGRKCSPSDETKQALNSPWPLSDAVLYCEQCNKPCCVSAVMNETGPVVLCLKHAVVELKKESSVKDFKILSRYDVARIDTLISKVEVKLKSLQGDAEADQTEA